MLLSADATCGLKAINKFRYILSEIKFEICHLHARRKSTVSEDGERDCKEVLAKDEIVQNKFA